MEAAETSIDDEPVLGSTDKSLGKCEELWDVESGIWTQWLKTQSANAKIPGFEGTNC